MAKRNSSGLGHVRGDTWNVYHISVNVQRVVHTGIPESATVLGTQQRGGFGRSTFRVEQVSRVRAAYLAGDTLQEFVTHGIKLGVGGECCQWLFNFRGFISSLTTRAFP